MMEIMMIVSNAKFSFHLFLWLQDQNPAGRVFGESLQQHLEGNLERHPSKKLQGSAVKATLLSSLPLQRRRRRRHEQ